MKLGVPLIATLALVGCQTAPEAASAPSATAAASAAPAPAVIETTSSRLTPEQVIAWADLPKTLARPRRMIIAQADGCGQLGDYVALLNGEEAKQFLIKHGYAKTLRVLSVRRTRSTITVDLEIQGKDGAKGHLILYADGGKQGVG